MLKAALTLWSPHPQQLEKTDPPCPPRPCPVRLAPTWLDGREVIAVWEQPQAAKPSYLMWLEWKDGRISFIRDYRYVRYVVDDAELVLASDALPPEALPPDQPIRQG